ncbi:MAG TPA: hypothetical protein VFL95_12145 [Gemmatimonadales bacterium]|nr:hypothetical protein [Gemmatimonadales bacterium]
MVSELGGSQISSLLETLPGIANVLRSPVADALVGVIRAASGSPNFHVADAEELIRYATRRGLMAEDEGAKLLDEIHQPAVARAASSPKTVSTKPAPKAAAKPAPRKPAKASPKPVRPERKSAKPAARKGAAVRATKPARKPARAAKSVKPIKKAAKHARKR